MQIQIKFGPFNTLTKDVPYGTTFGAVLSDASIKAALGFGDNVQAVVRGVAQPPERQVGDGDVIGVETRVGGKAS